MGQFRLKIGLTIRLIIRFIILQQQLGKTMSVMHFSKLSVQSFFPPAPFFCEAMFGFMFNLLPVSRAVGHYESRQLIKLRLNVPFQDLAYHFGVSVLTFSRTFTSWIRVMDSRLSRLIYWPEQKELWNTMPKRFLFSFGNRTVIIDCFEIFIEHPTDLLARAKTF